MIERGHEVTVAGIFTAGSEDTIATLRAEGFVVRSHVRPKSRLAETFSALARHPGLLRGAAKLSAKELVSSFFWVDLKAIVLDELATQQHDLVVIEMSFAAYWREYLETESPVLLVNHEVESVQQLAKAARIGGVGGFTRYLNGRRIRRSERDWSPQFDGIIVMSDDEARALEGVVGRGQLPRTYVVGNGADIDSLGAIGPDPDEQRVLFTGTMAYAPNAVGAQWLAREVWPLVLATVPGATLEIVGSRPSRRTRQLGGLPGVSVHADVPEMAPWFERSSICAVPMLEGGGTRLKLADAFAANRAVVSTTNGATGVDCRSGHDLLIADSADDFARAIVRLLADATMRGRIARHGRELAERLCDWDQLGDELDAVFTSVASNATTDLYSLRQRSATQ
jgi:glycosyltransferase involved in cell wall biosynthesis